MARVAFHLQTLVLAIGRISSLPSLPTVTAPPGTNSAGDAGAGAATTQLLASTSDGSDDDVAEQRVAAVEQLVPGWGRFSYSPSLQQARVVFVDRTLLVKRGDDVNLVMNDGTVVVGTVEWLEGRNDVRPYLVAACEFELWAKSPADVRARRAVFSDEDSTSDRVASVVQDCLTRIALAKVYAAGTVPR